MMVDGAPIRESVPGSSTGSSHHEESRQHLQLRLTLFAKILFWAYVALLAAVVVAFGVYSPGPASPAPREAPLVEAAAGCGLVLLGVTWRLILVRRTLTLRQLRRIDAFFAIGSGLVFATAAALAPDVRASPLINLTWACLVVFLRAIIVPSSGARTGMCSALTFMPMLVAASVLAQQQDMLPPSVFIVSSVFVSSGVTVLAVLGSRTIYGLRRQVRHAMQLGQYTLDRKIGEGGMGAVYLAHHALLRRPAAIKLVQPDRVDAESLDRFEREVQHMSKLTHPNTVAVFDYGRSADGVFYYAMEYLGGGIDLERLVRNYGAQPWGRVIHILRQACRALQEAHDHGIVHRDVKPANIILCERGGEPDVVKVVDYGVAKEIERNGHAHRGIVGTPAYVAPETITDPDHVGPAADLYALGGVGYFLLTGKRMFEGKSPSDVCVQHVTAVPRRPSELAAVPSDLDDLIMRCLAKQPASRPASARLLADELAGLAPDAAWSEAEALVWWRQYRRTLEHADTSAATASIAAPTLTIDLERR